MEFQDFKELNCKTCNVVQSCAKCVWEFREAEIEKLKRELESKIKVDNSFVMPMKYSCPRRIV